MREETVMTYRKFFRALLLAALLLCACGQQQPSPSGEPPSQAPSRSGLSWDDLAWSGRLQLDYAQMFAVDYGPENFKRITIDQDTYLVVPEGAEVPADVPDGVTVLCQPIQNIY